MMKKGLLAISILGVLLALSGPASADIINYTINLPDSGLAGHTAPYAEVQVNRLNQLNAVVTFTSDTTAGKTFLMGGLQAADVNVNATTWTIGSFVSTIVLGGGFVSGALSNGGSDPVNGFGVFNQTVDSRGDYAGSHNFISFALQNTSTTGVTRWFDAGSVLTPNAFGHVAAIHGFACTAPCTNSPTSTFLTSGFATVPEPASLLLLGAGLAGIGIWSWRRKSTR